MAVWSVVSIPCHRSGSAIALAICAALLVVSPLPGSDDPPSPRTYALLINGGQGPLANALSHLHHLQDMVEGLAARGIPAERIFVFSSDGEAPEDDLVVRGSLDPRLWLVEGTNLASALRRPDLTNTVWDDVQMKPATKAELRKWFEKKQVELVAGDTLFVFVTDHGTQNTDDPGNGLISLWEESLSVLEFRALLGHLRPGTRVVNVMSQCYSGAFAEAMAPFHDPTPTGDVCGFYSTTADRRAYGCYPEGRDRDRIGHAFHFIDAMGRNDTMDAAHVEVLVTDATPDVPLRTSDLYLERLLEQEAAKRDEEPETLVDALLREAWRDRGRLEPQIRLLDRLGSMYGVFSPRTLAEFEKHITELQALEKSLATYRSRWRMALDDLRRDNLAQFLESNPEWNERIAKRTLDSLSDVNRRKLVGALLPELESFTKEREDVFARLERLRDNFEDAESAEFRAAIRLAALLRMRTVLIRVAAKELFEGNPSPAFAALQACESAQIGTLAGEPEPPELKPLPPYEEDVAIVERVLPSWFGIQFASVPETQQEKYELERGAAVVQRVYDDSPAASAGILPGDFVLGPPGKPFDEPRRLREWIMGSPRDTPLTVEMLRQGEPFDVTISLAPYPTEIPRLPAPPAAGDEAPDLPPLRNVSGESDEPTTVASGRHVLFFWATWCAPCKAALPELVAWSETSNVPVLAVSDEDPETVRRFLDGWTEVFPEHVASDEMRLSYVSYGVSGTPTFVLVDDEGSVEWRQTGYSVNKGLSVDGWEWIQD
jgi:thiol-disulfide isomerase/thioredoxin